MNRAERRIAREFDVAATAELARLANQAFLVEDWPKHNLPIEDAPTFTTGMEPHAWQRRYAQPQLQALVLGERHSTASEGEAGYDGYFLTIDGIVVQESTLPRPRGLLAFLTLGEAVVVRQRVEPEAIATDPWLIDRLAEMATQAGVTAPNFQA